MTLRYTFAWFLLLIVAVANGTLRDWVYKNSLGELRAHQLSTFIAIMLFATVVGGLSRVWKLESASQAWTVGFIWLALTLAFEFLFFHYVAGKPWNVLLHDYNIMEGRVWILVVIWTTIAPAVFFYLDKR